MAQQPKPTSIAPLPPPPQPPQNITSAIFQPIVQPAPSRRHTTSGAQPGRDPSKLPASCIPQEGPGPRLVWLVTGATGLLGSEIVKTALFKGDLVVAVARGIPDALLKEKESNPPPEGKLWTHERCLPLRCDVRLKAQIEAVVKKCIDRFGQLDVVVK